MQSKVASIAEYLAELPEDRRSAISAVHEAILAALPEGYEAGMQYGMIGYYVPHSIYPPGYHCDRSQPLNFAGLGNQKNHMSLYLMCIYGSDRLRTEFEAEYAARGKKLDMGKACIRFKKLDDLALDVVTKTIASISVADYIAEYEKVLNRGK